MSAFLATVLVLTPSGLGLFQHQKPAGACCDTRATEISRVQSLICTMQTHQKWQKRDDAAHALRKFDAHCHPEIGSALAATLLHDCHEEVREEAAETLAKLAPCQPDVHAALIQSSRCDPDHATRKWANRALRNLKDECLTACNICDSGPTGYVIPVRPATYTLPLRTPMPARGTVVGPTAPYTVLPSTGINSGQPVYDYETTPPDDLPPVEIAPPELPPNPSPFLPGATREQDDTANEPTIRRASSPRDPVLIRFGQRVFGRDR